MTTKCMPTPKLYDNTTASKGDRVKALLSWMETTGEGGAPKMWPHVTTQKDTYAISPESYKKLEEKLTALEGCERGHEKIIVSIMGGPSRSASQGVTYDVTSIEPAAKLTSLGDVRSETVNGKEKFYAMGERRPVELKGMTREIREVLLPAVANRDGSRVLGAMKDGKFEVWEAVKREVRPGVVPRPGDDFEQLGFGFDNILR